VFIQRFPIPNHTTSLQKITVAETGGNTTSTGQSWCPNDIIQKTYCTEQLIHTNKIKQESLYSLHSSVAEKGKTYATAKQGLHMRSYIFNGRAGTARAAISCSKSRPPQEPKHQTGRKLHTGLQLPNARVRSHQTAYLWQGMLFATCKLCSGNRWPLMILCLRENFIRGDIFAPLNIGGRKPTGLPSAFSFRPAVGSNLVQAQKE